MVPVIKFSVRANLDHVRCCNCSICTKRGSLNHRVEEQDFTLLTPLAELSLYEWGTMTAKDYFCPHCGIPAFRKPSQLSKEEQAMGAKPFYGWSINVRCLDAVDINQLPVKQINGRDIQILRSNH